MDMNFLKQKAEQLCSRSELCEFDVVQKLTAWKCSGDEVELVLAHLRENGFVDDARYATAFAIGKNHQLKWGRTKIAYQLRMKRVDPKVIDQALFMINEEEYLSQACQVAAQKWRTLHDTDRYAKVGKLSAYMQAKGYEGYAIKHAIEHVEEG